MAQRNDRIADHIRAALAVDPGLTSKALYESAQRVDPSFRCDSVRSFHARYVLAAKRSVGAMDRARRHRDIIRRQGRTTNAAAVLRVERASSADAERSRIRGILIQFARAVAAAETRQDVLSVVASVDLYVDQVLE